MSYSKPFCQMDNFNKKLNFRFFFNFWEDHAFSNHMFDQQCSKGHRKRQQLTLKKPTIERDL